MATPAAAAPHPPLDLSSIRSLLHEAVPDTPSIIHGCFASTEDSPPLKTLPELLGALGNPVSCPFCAVPLARPSAPRLCLACGKALRPAPAGAQWEFRGSLAERRFVASLGLQGETGKSSSRSSTIFVSEAESTGAAAEEPVARGDVLQDDFFLGGNAAAALAPVHMSRSASFTGSSMNLHMFGSHSPNSSPIHGPNTGLASMNGKEDFFSQLSGLEALASAMEHTPPSASTGMDSAEVEKTLRGVSDLSFMLSDHLTIPERDPGGRIALPLTSHDLPAAEKFEPKAEPLKMQGVNDNDDESKDEWGDFTS